MKFLLVFEICFVIAFIALMVSQVIIPLWRDTKLFPFFRKEQKLIGDIASAHQAEVERQLRRKLSDLTVVDVPVASDSGNPKQS